MSLGGRGENDQAQVAFQRSCAILEQLTTEFPKNELYCAQLATSSMEYVRVLRQSGRGAGQHVRRPRAGDRRERPVPAARENRRRYPCRRERLVRAGKCAGGGCCARPIRCASSGCRRGWTPTT
jgi:hypothetical protein